MTHKSQQAKRSESEVFTASGAAEFSIGGFSNKGGTSSFQHVCNAAHCFPLGSVLLDAALTYATCQNTDVQSCVQQAPGQLQALPLMERTVEGTDVRDYSPMAFAFCGSQLPLKTTQTAVYRNRQPCVVCSRNT